MVMISIDRLLLVSWRFKMVVMWRRASVAQAVANVRRLLWRMFQPYH